MKKLFVLCLVLLLTGCAPQPVFETVEDVPVAPAAAQKRLQLTLPEEAALLTSVTDTGSLYFCDGYTLCVQTLAAGDLERSLVTLTGFDRESLTVMQREQAGYRRYDTAWTAAGEGGTQTGRLVLLDDGNLHYAVTVMADSGVAGDLQTGWNELLETVELVAAN